MDTEMVRRSNIYTNKKYWGLSLGRTTSTLFLSALTAPFQTLFLVGMIGIPNDVYGIMGSITTVISLIFVFASGVLIQNVKLPWGKYRSWLYVGSISAATGLVIMFTDFGMSNGTLKYLIYGACVILVPNFFNISNSAFYALFPILADKPEDRVAVSAMNNQIGNVISIAIRSINVPLIVGVGSLVGSQVLGYSLYSYIVIALIVTTIFGLAHIAKPYDPGKKELKAGQEKPQVMKKSGSAKALDMVKSFFMPANLSYQLSESFLGFASTLITTSAGFYYLYVVKDVALFALFNSLTAFLSLAGSFMPILFVKLFHWQAKTIILVCTFLSAVLIGISYFSVDSALTFTFLLSAYNVFFSCERATALGYYTDCVEYSCVKGSLPTLGFQMSLASLPGKLASTLAPTTVAFALSAIDFNVKNVTPKAVAGIHVLMSVVPTMLLIIGAILYILNPCNRKSMNSIKLAR